jgi:hypothetical protein
MVSYFEYRSYFLNLKPNGELFVVDLNTVLDITGSTDVKIQRVENLALTEESYNKDNRVLSVEDIKELRGIQKK